jgi:hypothetical protein
MNFFKIKTSWSNAELALLKICIATAYILIGAYFHIFFKHHYIPILAVFAITVIWSTYLWFKKMKTQK